MDHKGEKVTGGARNVWAKYQRSLSLAETRRGEYISLVANHRPTSPIHKWDSHCNFNTMEIPFLFAKVGNDFITTNLIALFSKCIAVVSYQRKKNRQRNMNWPCLGLFCLYDTLQWRRDERDGLSIIDVSIVYTTGCWGADQRKYHSSASLAFVRGIHQWPVNSPHKGPVTRKMFPFDDVITKTFCRLFRGALLWKSDFTGNEIDKYQENYWQWYWVGDIYLEI